MEAAVDCSTENLQSLEGLSISDLISNMAATIPSLTENFKNVSEALEEDKITEFDKKQEAKEHLLQSFKNLVGKINEQPESSMLVMNEVCVVADDDELKYLAERVRKREDKINELRKKKTHALMDLDDLVQSSEEKPTKAPERTLFAQKAKEHSLQNFQNLAGRIDQQPPIINREDVITDLKKKKEDKMIELQKKKEAKKHLSQRVQNLGRMIDELEQKEDYIVASKFHGVSFADQ